MTLNLVDLIKEKIRTDAPREDHVKAQREYGHVKAEERGPQKKPTLMTL